MDLEYIEQLARLIGGSTVSEVTVRRGDRGVTLRRKPGEAVVEAAPTVAGEPDLSTDVKAIGPLGETLLPIALGTAGALTAAAESEPRSEILVAHRVGYFRRGQQEGGEPLVQVGDWVAPGQQLGSIESMKVFDEVDSSVGGIVVGIFVADGDAVQYGQDLFHIEICDEPEGTPADSPEEAEEP